MLSNGKCVIPLDSVLQGGKDCSALLHLIHAVWSSRNRGGSGGVDGSKLRALYIRGQDPFPEMEQFIEDTRQRHITNSIKSSSLLLLLSTALSYPSTRRRSPLIPIHSTRSLSLTLIDLIHLAPLGCNYCVSFIDPISPLGIDRREPNSLPVSLIQCQSLFLYL